MSASGSPAIPAASEAPMPSCQCAATTVVTPAGTSAAASSAAAPSTTTTSSQPPSSRVRDRARDPGLAVRGPRERLRAAEPGPASCCEHQTDDIRHPRIPSYWSVSGCGPYRCAPMSTTRTKPSPELRRWRNAVFTIFALTGFVFATWASRVPNVRDLLHADTQEMGFVILGLSAGSIVGVILASHIIARLGATRTILIAYSAVSLAMILLGFVVSFAPHSCRSSSRWR